MTSWSKRMRDKGITVYVDHDHSPPLIPNGHTPLQHAEVELVAAAVAFVQNHGSTGATKHLYECAYRYTKTLEDGEDPREIIRGLLARIEELEAELIETRAT